MFSILVSAFSLRVWWNISSNYYVLSTRHPALRGNIYDSRGRLVSTSEVVYGAYLDLDYLRKVAGTAFRRDPDFLRLLSNFGVSEYINRTVESKMLKLGTFRTRDEIVRKIPTQYLRFVSIEPEERRITITEGGLGFVVGRAEARTGIGGVEEFYDKTLRPVRDGYVAVSYSGFMRSTIRKREETPQNGKNVVITIDSVLQKVLYQEALRSREEKKAQEVGIILMETKTGKVRVALTTRDWPTFYMGYLEPGSTIKPLIFAAALELGVVEPSTKFQCPGYVKPIRDGGVVIRDVKPYGELDLRMGLVHSSNVVAVETARRIVEKFGVEKLYEVLVSLGFGETTGVELPREVPGVLRPPKKWNRADWAYISIGQSVGVTPVQLIAAVNTILNDGVYVKPTFDETSPPTWRRVFSPKTCGLVKEMMRDVVERGSGKLARVEGKVILGKTGTSQKPDLKEVTTLFVGSTDIGNVQYTVLVWVDGPQTERLSSLVAAPLFKRVVEVIEDYLSQRSNTIDLVTGDPDATSLTVDLRGLNIQRLAQIARSAGYEVRSTGEGFYVSEYRVTSTPNGTRLEVSLSETPPKLAALGMRAQK